MTPELRKVLEQAREALRNSLSLCVFCFGEADARCCRACKDTASAIAAIDAELLREEVREWRLVNKDGIAAGFTSRDEKHVERMWADHIAAFGPGSYRIEQRTAAVTIPAGPWEVRK